MAAPDGGESPEKQLGELSLSGEKKGGKYVPPHLRGRSTEPQPQEPQQPYVQFRRSFSPPAPTNRYVPPPVAAAAAAAGGSSSSPYSASPSSGASTGRWSRDTGDRRGSGGGSNSSNSNSNSSNSSSGGAWRGASSSQRDTGRGWQGAGKEAQSVASPPTRNQFSALEVEDEAEASSRGGSSPSLGSSPSARGPYQPPLRRQAGEFGSSSNSRADALRGPAGLNDRKVTLLFGDSYVGIFSLVKTEENPDISVQVIKFKGATASGVGKTLNPNRLDVEKRISSCRGRLKALMFNFGQVDVHLSYYYKRFIQKSELESDRIVKSYVEFARTVGGSDLTCPRIILAVYPCPVRDEDVLKSLLLYHVITDDDALQVDPSDPVFSRAHRAKLLDDFNSALERECAAQGVTFLSLNDQILDETRDVRPTFRDISIYNIHILWEPTIVLWTKFLAPYGISDENLAKLDKSWNAYKEYKTSELKSINVEDVEFAYAPAQGGGGEAPALAKSSEAKSEAAKPEDKKHVPEFVFKSDD
jgi:hypothetical protein